MMHGREKSDSAIVAGKPTNKAVPTAAEPVERRAEAKGNATENRATCPNSVSKAVNLIVPPFLVLSSCDLVNSGRSRCIVECNCHQRFGDSGCRRRNGELREPVRQLLVVFTVQHFCLLRKGGK